VKLKDEKFISRSQRGAGSQTPIIMVAVISAQGESSPRAIRLMQNKRTIREISSWKKSRARESISTQQLRHPLRFGLLPSRKDRIDFVVHFRALS